MLSREAPNVAWRDRETGKPSFSETAELICCSIDSWARVRLKREVRVKNFIIFSRGNCF